MLCRIDHWLLNILFKYVIAINLVPYKWNPQNLQLKVTKSKFRTFLWKWVVFCQISHFLFLGIRLYHSLENGTRPSLLLFQLVWNTLFSCAIFGQFCAAFRKYDFPNLVTKWLKNESKDPKIGSGKFRSSVLLEFLISLLTCTIAQIIGLIFNYIRNPTQSQYIISFVQEIADLEHGQLWFGLVESTLIMYLWGMILLFMTTLMGSTAYIHRQLIKIRQMKNGRDALKAFTNVHKFALEYVNAFHELAFSTKICIATCSIISVYNCLMADLPPLPYSIMPSTAIACIVVFKYCFYPVCLLSDSSEITKASRRQDALVGSWERKYWKAFCPISMKIGPFYSLSKNTVLLYFDFIVMSVINLILLFPS